MFVNITMREKIESNELQDSMENTAIHDPLILLPKKRVVKKVFVTMVKMEMENVTVKRKASTLIDFVEKTLMIRKVKKTKKSNKNLVS